MQGQLQNVLLAFGGIAMQAEPPRRLVDAEKRFPGILAVLAVRLLGAAAAEQLIRQAQPVANGLQPAAPHGLFALGHTGRTRLHQSCRLAHCQQDRFLGAIE